MSSPGDIPADALPARRRVLYGPAGRHALFTDNETNCRARLRAGADQSQPYVKDAFHRHIIDGEDCTQPRRIGTKAAIHYRFDACRPGESVSAPLAADRQAAT